MCKGSASEPQDSKTTPRQMQHYILLVTFHVSVTAVPDRMQQRGGRVHLTSWFQRASVHCGSEGMVAEFVVMGLGIVVTQIREQRVRFTEDTEMNSDKFLAQFWERK